MPWGASEPCAAPARRQSLPVPVWREPHRRLTSTIGVIPTSPAACPADFDANGWVDGVDMGVLLAAWGTPTRDLNGDGQTDGVDLGILLGAWGQCGG